MQREHVVTSPLEVHEKLCVHYQRQLMRGWPHANVMAQFSDVRCGLVVLWKRGRKFTGAYSEAKLKVCSIGHLQGCMRAWVYVHISSYVPCGMCMCLTNNYSTHGA